MSRKHPPVAASLPAPTLAPASALVEPFFIRRETVDRTTHQVMGQERATVRRFFEVCRDKPPSFYGRGDILTFLGQLRLLPKSYGKSPRDKDRLFADIIAQAEVEQSARLEDKTVKRHLSALSQFFQTAVDAGHLSVSQRNELVEDHRFKAKRAAKDERDPWEVPDLIALFSSPVWAGCAGLHRRNMVGPEVIRDARFWLPLLALFHGARLEEFADLSRRDVRQEDGTWLFDIVESDTRRLKTKNAERVVPLHPQIVLLGFLDYVTAIAPMPSDPLFPDLEPQGKDKKRGPRITRWFVEYRKAIAIYRPGVAMHAFRHNARTRLADVVTDKRPLNFLFGHAAGGGEGDTRYDKGPGLKVLAATVALLSYPEIDLSHLYRTAPAGAAV